MKMMQGAFSRALLKTSRTIRGPSPSHLPLSALPRRLLLHELAAHHLDEVRSRRVGHCLRQHRFPRAGRTVHQHLSLREEPDEHASRGVDADLRENLGVKKRELDRFAELLLLHI